MGLYYTYHYGVSIHTRSGKKQLHLYEHLKDALHEAKFMVHNAEHVTVISLDTASFVGKELYQTRKKVKLEKVDKDV